jgi:hypothetical protein
MKTKQKMETEELRMLELEMALKAAQRTLQTVEQQGIQRKYHYKEVEYAARQLRIANQN